MLVTQSPRLGFLAADPIACLSLKGEPLPTVTATSSCRDLAGELLVAQAPDAPHRTATTPWDGTALLPPPLRSWGASQDR